MRETSRDVAVVVAAFNHEKFIEEALVSVSRQTVLPTEVVVIDDCSDDRTAEIAEESLERHLAPLGVKTLLICNEVNAGSPSSFGSGVRRSHSEVIALLNSDDVFHPERLERLLAGMESGSSWSFSGVSFLGDEGVKRQSMKLLSQYGFWSRVMPDFPSAGFALLHFNTVISSGNLMFTRSLWEEVGGFSALDLSHDWHFALRCLAMSEPYYVESPLYFYRLHEANTFKGLAKVGHLERDETRQVREDYIQWSRVAGRNPIRPALETWPTVFSAFARESRLATDLAPSAATYPHQQDS